MKESKRIITNLQYAMDGKVIFFAGHLHKVYIKYQQLKVYNDHCTTLYPKIKNINNCTKGSGLTMEEIETTIQNFNKLELDKYERLVPYYTTYY